MVRLLLSVLLLAGFACAGQAKTLRSDAALADGVVLEISAEVPDSGLIVQEMAVVSITAAFRDPLNLFELESSIFPNARAVQLGKDSWALEGVSALTLKRRIAVFPQKSGTLSIGPFRVDATVTTPEGGRRQIRLETPPLTIPVAAAPEGAGTWWLPVRSLSVRDEWAPDPQEIPADGLARRTVTIEALGAMGEQLPPVPLLRSPPIVTFALPETRETVVTAEGPVGRVAYRWDVRAAHDEPTVLEGVTIPWFDTTARAMEEARIPERRVAERLLLVPRESDARAQLLALLDLRAIALGAAAGLALLGLAFWLLARHPERAALKALARAARRNDAREAERLVSALTLREPLRPSGEAAQLASALHRHLHAVGTYPCPDLKRLSAGVTRELTSRWKRSHGLRQRTTGLLPLESTRSEPSR